MDAPAGTQLRWPPYAGEGGQGEAGLPETRGNANLIVGSGRRTDSPWLGANALAVLGGL